MDWFKFEMCDYAYNLPLEVVKFWRGDFNSLFLYYFVILNDFQAIVYSYFICTHCYYYLNVYLLHVCCGFKLVFQFVSLLYRYFMCLLKKNACVVE